MLEYGNDGQTEYRLLEGHALSWPDATERVPPGLPTEHTEKMRWRGLFGRWKRRLAASTLHEQNDLWARNARQKTSLEYGGIYETAERLTRRSAIVA